MLDMPLPGLFAGVFGVPGYLLCHHYFDVMLGFVAFTWLIRSVLMLYGHKHHYMGYMLTWIGWIDIAVFTFCLQQLYFLNTDYLLISAGLIAGIDSCGYFAGKFYGKMRIIPAISPNKTLEGYMGAFVWLMVCFLMLLIVRDIQILYLTLFLSMVYVLAITGDLLVSYQKRILGVKDTGSMIPGHGGLLDRFDSWMYVIPFVYLIALIN